MNLSAIQASVTQGYILWSDKDLRAFYGALLQYLSPNYATVVQESVPVTIVFSDGNKMYCNAVSHPDTGAYYVDQYILFPKQSYTWAINIIDKNIYPGDVRKLRFYRLFYNYM